MAGKENLVALQEDRVEEKDEARLQAFRVTGSEVSEGTEMQQAEREKERSSVFDFVPEMDRDERVQKDTEVTENGLGEEVQQTGTERKDTRKVGTTRKGGMGIG